MNEKMKKQIYDRFDAFMNSDSFNTLAKGQDSFAKRLRIYKKRRKEGTLKPYAALSILVDCGEVKEIVFN